MIWIYWLVGGLWIVDGSLFIAFPAKVRNLFVRAFRDAHFLAASAGPAAVAALLAAASFRGPHPWALRLLAAFSAVQAVYFYRAIRTSSPRPIERLIALPNRLYRWWGAALAALGPVVILLRPN